MERKKRPGYLTQYAIHAGISKQAAGEQLRRVGIQYLEPFDFTEADKLRLAMRHADRAPFAKPIYVEPGASLLGPDNSDESDQAPPNDPAFAQLQARREHFRAEIARLDYEERIATLVRRDAVQVDAFRIGRLVRDGMLNIPSRLAGILAAETDQRKIYDLLEREIRQALEALALQTDDTGGTEAA